MTSKTRTKRAYIEEFKRKAVALITEQGDKIAQAARSLDLEANLLGRWKHQFEIQVTGARLGADEWQELKRLHKEVRQLRLEKEI
jgi:transposase